MDKWILTSLQLLDFKLIAVIIFEELAPVEFYNVRSLTDPPYAYLSDDFCLLVCSESLRADFLFFMRFCTPKTTPPTPTPMTSYTSVNSFHSNMMLKALLSKSTVN